jgi:hypothetical protein
LTKEPEEHPESVAGSAKEAEGFGSRLLAQARKAGEQVQASAAELGDLTAAKAGELKDAGFALLMEALDDFNAALPAAREAGYSLQTINVALALMPKVTATFAAPDDVKAEEVDRILATHADQRFTIALVKSLYQAWQVQRKVHVAGLKPSSLSVLIGLPPSVTINFA